LNFSGDARNAIVRLAQRHNGDADAVLKALREAKKAGGYDISRNLTFLSTTDIDDLRHLGMYDEILTDVLEAEDLDDALRRLDEIRTEYARQAAENVRQPTVLSELNELYGILDESMEGLTPKAQESIRDLVSKRYHIDQMTKREAARAVGRLRVEAGMVLTEALGKERAGEIVESFSRKVDELLDGNWLRTRKKADQLLANTRKWSDSMLQVGRMRDTKRKQAALRRLWSEARLGDYFPVPEELNAKAMRDMLWETVYPSRRQDIYGADRDLSVALRQQEGYGWLRTVAEEGAEIPLSKFDSVFAKTEADQNLAKILEEAYLKDGELFVRMPPDPTVRIYRSTKIGVPPAAGREWAADLETARRFHGPDREMVYMDIPKSAGMRR